MVQDIRGANPSAYLGVYSIDPPDFYKFKRDPTVNDTSGVRGYTVGDFWENTTNYNLWYLAANTGTVATWILLGGGSGALLRLQGASNGVPVGSPVNPILGTIQVNNTDGFIDIQAGVPNPNNLNFNLSSNFISSGPWTPVLNFSTSTDTITYLNQQGYYFRIGSIVNIAMTITVTDIGTSSGNAYITGMPFPKFVPQAPGTTLGQQQNMSFQYLTFNAGYTFCWGTFLGTTNQLYLEMGGSGLIDNSFTDVNFAGMPATGWVIALKGWYFVTA